MVKPTTSPVRPRSLDLRCHESFPAIFSRPPPAIPPIIEIVEEHDEADCPPSYDEVLRAENAPCYSPVPGPSSAPTAPPLHTPDYSEDYVADLVVKFYEEIRTYQWRVVIKVVYYSPMKPFLPACEKCRDMGFNVSRRFEYEDVVDWHTDCFKRYL